MNARDGLIALFEAGGPHRCFSVEEAVDIELAKHAHELAEKLRGQTLGHDDGCRVCYTTRRNADLIDPKEGE